MRSVLKPIAAATTVIAAFSAGYLLFAQPRPPKQTAPPAVPAAPADALPAPHTPEPPPAPPPALSPKTAWNTYHGDAALTGVTNAALPNRLELLWRFKAGAPVRETPVVCNGRVFFASARGEVFAVDTEGRRLWSHELYTGEQRQDAPLRARIEAPLACFDGLVLAGTMGGTVHALDVLTGADTWQVRLDSPVMGSVNYLPGDAGGRVYVIGQAEGTLHCFDAGTGRALWRSEAIDQCDGSPAVSSEAVAFGSCAAALHVLSPNTGALLRNIELGADSQVAGGVALHQGAVISGSRSGAIVCADTHTGNIAWTYTGIGAEVFTTPAVNTQWVIVGASDGYVYALDRSTGEQRWNFDAGCTPSSAVIADGNVLVTAAGRLIMLTLEDGKQVWAFKVSDEITSPAAAHDRVFVGSEDGTVVAFGPPAQGGSELQ